MRLAQAMALVVAASVPAAAQEAAPSVPYWHLWTGQDGKSHLTKCAMTGFTQQAITKQWQRPDTNSANVVFAVDPKGDWHENPKVQWVVTLQGAFYLKAQDDTEVTLRPGDLLLGEDLHTTADTHGNKGHVSASRGDKPVALMFAQIPVEPTIGQPCHAR